MIPDAALFCFISEFSGLGKGFCADYPGHCVAFDTVVRFIGRTRRYLLTATDHASRFALAIAVQRHDSHHAARFAELVKTMFPGHIEQILTDNGSEFQGAFADYAKTQRWRHCHTYPRSPKMNAFNERFNRTVQEDFVDYEEDLLLEDLRLFNQRLLDYLDRYNGQRPHQGINYRTPCQMLAQHMPRLSHMWWRSTVGGSIFGMVVFFPRVGFVVLAAAG